jgi:hypothetical protein
MKRTAPRVLTFRIDQALYDALVQIGERDGISQSKAIRRALEMWLDSKGITVKKPKEGLRR